MSFWRQLIYSAGTTGYMLVERMIVAYAIYFFLPPEDSGLPVLISQQKMIIFGSVFGLITLLGRVVDAITDPWIATLSDNSRSKLGRRRLFMLLGAAPMPVFCVLMFYPPHDHASTLNAAYLAVIFGAFWVAYTAYVAPYQALIPELTRTVRERVGITTWQALFAMVGVILGLVVVPAVWDGLQSSGMDKVSALRAIILAFGIVGLIIMLAAAIVVREPKPEERPVGESTGMWSSVKLAWANREFRIYLGGYITFWFGFNMITKSTLYYVTVLLKKTEGFQSIVLGVLLLVSLICIPLINIASRRFGRRNVFVWGLFTFAVLMCGIFFLGDVGATGAIILFALMGLPVAIREVVPNALLAEICDLDTKRTGTRREAIFFGVQGFLNKLNIGVSGAVLAWLLVTFGKSQADPLGVQLTGPVAALFCLAGALVFMRFPGGGPETRSVAKD